MKRLINVLIAQYLSCFTLNMCLCFSFRLWCHKREKRKQRYLIIAPPLIISAPSDSELSRVIYLFILLNEDSIVHCVLWFFFQKARSESDCKVPPPLPADVRPLNPFAAVMQVLRTFSHFVLFLSTFIQRTTCIVKDFLLWGVSFESCGSDLYYVPLLTCESIKF